MRRRTFILGSLALLLSLKLRDRPEKGDTMNFDMANEQELDRQLLRELLFEFEVDGQKYPVGQPSAGLYKGEDYGWDPAFFIHSLLAVGETETALRMMDGNAKKIELAGYLPLVTRWNPADHDFLWKKRTKADPRFTAETQQPMTAQTALRLVREVGFDNLDRERVLAWTQAGQTHIDWLMDNRRAKGRQLFFIIDPVESGEDTLPAWDEIAYAKGWHILPKFERIFTLPGKLNLSYIQKGWDLDAIEADSSSVLIEPVSLNVFAIREMRALSSLWRMLANSGMASRVEAWAKDQTEVLESLWDEGAGAYFSTARFEDGWRKMPVHSVESLYPLLLPDLPVDRVGHLVQTIEQKFVPKASYLLPVAPVGLGHFQRVFGVIVPIWREEQVWTNVNWFFRDSLAYQASRLQGSEAGLAQGLSERIDSDWLKLKGLAGYPEFYYQDGAGGAEKRFFWSCLRRGGFGIEIK